MGGGGGGGGAKSSSSNSSGEEDGDAEWRAAIESVAAADFSGPARLRPAAAAAAAEVAGSKRGAASEDEKPKTPGLKLYQIKAKKLLDDLLEKNIEIVRTPASHLSDTAQSDGGGIKLFRKAPPGIILDTVDSYPRPDKKPRILPGEEIDEKSKKFRRQLQSVAIDGDDVIASAREASRKSLARFEAKEAAVKAAAKREEERVLELRRIRGEKWLPSIAREMKDKTSAQRGG